jgi:signal recognition particle receptor subunit beta
MPTYNYKSRELIAKIVYYGPGRCGKTTNLQQIHARMRPETRSELLSVATETDRTIYFDLLPLNLGTIGGMKFMVRLFTVPGQVYYAETRKLVLRGADGIVFVADSQDHMMDENRQSLRDLRENLAANGIDYNTIPLVLQYNKRDLPRLIPEPELDAALNDRRVKSLSAVASEATGVLETLRFVTLAVFNHIKAGGKLNEKGAGAPVAAAAASAAGIASSAPVPMTYGGAPASSGLPTMPPPDAQGRATGGVGSLTGHGGALQRALAAAQASARAATNDLYPGSQSVGTGGPNAFSGPVGSSVRAQSVTGPQTSSRVSSLPPMPPPGTQPPRPVGPLNPNGPQPVKISGDLVLDEFKHLAVMHSQMAERLAVIEAELSRLGRENQEIREILARHNQA